MIKSMDLLFPYSGMWLQKIRLSSMENCEYVNNRSGRVLFYVWNAEDPGMDLSYEAIRQKN